MSKHANTAVCPKCEEVLQGCHEEIRKWLRILRLSHPDAHIASDGGYRNKAQQEEAILRRASRIKYPFSKHNLMKDGLPCSEAMDLFRQDDQGNGYWQVGYFLKLHIFFEDQGAPIIWGGTFKHPDPPHFELNRHDQGNNEQLG